MSEVEGLTVVVGGREFSLRRPVGRAGRLYIAKVQQAMRRVVPIIELYSEKNENEAQQLDVLLQASSDIFLDERLKFETEILPGLLMYSDAGMTKRQALDFLNSIDDPPLQLVLTFFDAAQYWLTGSSPEALADAIKKSMTGEETEEE